MWTSPQSVRDKVSSFGENYEVLSLTAVCLPGKNLCPTALDPKERTVAYFSQSSPCFTSRTHWPQTITSGLLGLLLLLWDLPPSSNLGWGWLAPITLSPPCLESGFYPMGCGWQPQILTSSGLEQSSTTQSWGQGSEILVAWPSRGDSVALDWKLGGQGAPCFLLQPPKAGSFRISWRARGRECGSLVKIP